MPARVTDALLRFARQASEASSARAVMPLLVGTLREQTGADAVAVLRTEGDRLVVEAADGLPEAVASWSCDAEDLGPPAARALAAATGTFEDASLLPLVAGRGLFGAVVLFHAPGAAPTERHTEVAAGLADLAAGALQRLAQIDELRRSHAELRASQDAMLRSERLRVIGQMAAGVTHDLKNLLNPLSLYLQLAQRSLAKGDVAGALEGIESMRAALRHGVEVIERMRTFSRDRDASPATTADLSELAREALELARPRAASRGGRVPELRLEPGAAPPVCVRTGEVVSALLNLIVNAVDALDGGDGTVTVRTGEERGGAFAEVSDTGPGMSEDVQRRLFEPFFTTKGADGTGLGLPSVLACVDAHHGVVHVRSAPGEGTTFHVWLPPAQ